MSAATSVNRSPGGSSTVTLCLGARRLVDVPAGFSAKVTRRSSLAPNTTSVWRSSLSRWKRWVMSSLVSGLLDEEVDVGGPVVADVGAVDEVADGPSMGMT